MVATVEDQFAELARVYVTNVGYPSIHVYTVDEAFANWLRCYYGARIIQHKGTLDVVISRRAKIGAACSLLVHYVERRKRGVFKALLEYCDAPTPEARERKIKIIRYKLRLLSDN